MPRFWFPACVSQRYFSLSGLLDAVSFAAGCAATMFTIRAETKSLRNPQVLVLFSLLRVSLYIFIWLKGSTFMHINDTYKIFSHEYFYLTKSITTSETFCISCMNLVVRVPFLIGCVAAIRMVTSPFKLQSSIRVRWRKADWQVSGKVGVLKQNAIK